MMISLDKHPKQIEIDKQMKEAQFILNKNNDDLSYVSDEEVIDVEVREVMYYTTVDLRVGTSEQCDPN